MRLFTKKVIKKAGLAPGTLVHVGERKVANIRIRLIDYYEDRFEERDLKTIDECLAYKGKESVTWVNVDGLHDINLISDIGKFFDLHPLVLEDIVNTEQRPKMDDYEEYIFIVSKMLYYDAELHEIQFEQLSLILCNNFVISFQENEGDVFEPVRERLRKGKGKIRKMGPDYLLYALMDALVDSYFHVLENI